MRSQNFQCGSQWLNWGWGGIRHRILRLVAGREGTSVWSRGECSVRRMLQSELALHPNQRCGGCASWQSIFHTKGRPPRPTPSPLRHPLSHNCGPVQRGREDSGDRHTDRQTERQYIQAKIDRVGPKRQSQAQHPGDEKRQRHRVNRDTRRV